MGKGTNVVTSGPCSTARYLLENKVNRDKTPVQLTPGTIYSKLVTIQIELLLQISGVSVF